MAVPTFTASEISDIRRYCGYPVAAAFQSQIPDVRSGSAALDVVIAAVTPEQIVTIRVVYLARLNAMELAFADAYDGLDIKKAAVYERNPNELADRDFHFTAFRRNLCWFLGVPFGLGVAPLYPAALVV